MLDSTGLDQSWGSLPLASEQGSIRVVKTIGERFGVLLEKVFLTLKKETQEEVPPFLFPTLFSSFPPFFPLRCTGYWNCRHHLESRRRAEWGRWKTHGVFYGFIESWII